MTLLSSAELTADALSMATYLTELGCVMQREEPNFPTEEVENLKWLSDIIKQMDSERGRLHENLEAKTIACSILRYQIAAFPGRVQKELSDALQSAKCSNAKQMENLQGDLSKLVTCSAETDKKNEVLEIHNDVLEPERKMLSLRYKYLVEVVNSLMAERALTKIGLNETCDKFQMTESEIEKFYSDLEQVQNKMKLSKVSFLAEKAAMLDALESTCAMFVKIVKKNQQLSRECEKLGADFNIAMTLVKSQQQTSSEIESRIEELLKHELQVVENQRKETLKAQQIKQTCMEMKIQCGTFQVECQQKGNQVNDLTEQYLLEAQEVQFQVKSLTVTRSFLLKDLKNEHDSMSVNQLSISSIQENMDTFKRTMLYQAEEGSRLEKETRQLNNALMQLLECHQVTVQLYEQKVTKLQEDLLTTMDARENWQVKYRSLQSKMSYQETHYAHCKALFSCSMTRSSKNNETLLQKLSRLENYHDTLEEHAVSLTRELFSTNTDFKKFKFGSQTRANILELLMTTGQDQCIASNEGEDSYNEKNDQLEKSLPKQVLVLHILKPSTAALESEHRETSLNFETQKNTIIVLKNKRSGLKEMTTRLQEQLQKMDEPQEKLRLSTLRLRAYARVKLTEQMKQTEKVEKDAILAQQQLTSVLKENERIHVMMQSIQNNCLYLVKVLKASDVVRSRFEEEIKITKETLKIMWMENTHLEKDHSKNDDVLRRNIASVHEQSMDKETLTCVAYLKFEELLYTFSQLLHR